MKLERNDHRDNIRYLFNHSLLLSSASPNQCSNSSLHCLSFGLLQPLLSLFSYMHLSSSCYSADHIYLYFKFINVFKELHFSTRFQPSLPDVFMAYPHFRLQGPGEQGYLYFICYSNYGTQHMGHRYLLILFPLSTVIVSLALALCAHCLAEWATKRVVNKRGKSLFQFYSGGLALF